jgi:hypothetical protein
MRLLKAVMRLLGLGQSPSTQPLVQQEQPLPTAKPLRAKSGRPSKSVEQQPSAPAKPKRKYVRKAAPSTKVEASPKPAQKSARKTSGGTGKSAATPARKTRQHAK